MPERLIRCTPVADTALADKSSLALQTNGLFLSRSVSVGSMACGNHGRQRSKSRRRRALTIAIECGFISRQWALGLSMCRVVDLPKFCPWQLSHVGMLTQAMRSGMPMSTMLP